jgi:hypothetical protein
MSHARFAAAMVAIVILVTTAIANESNEETPKELLELCAQVRCYPPGPLRLNLDDGSVAEFQSRHPLPVVHDGLVAIYPGTTLYIAGEIERGKLVSMRAIDEPKEPSRVLKLRMWQDAGKADTFLQVTNYFPEDIKFRAGMMLPSGDDVHATSSCPVLSKGRFVFEHWPHAIFQLLLDEFHVVDTSSGEAVCE